VVWIRIGRFSVGGRPLEIGTDVRFEISGRVRRHPRTFAIAAAAIAPSAAPSAPSPATIAATVGGSAATLLCGVTGGESLVGYGVVIIGVHGRMLRTLIM
jgi:hypothetical protein